MSDPLPLVQAFKLTISVKENITDEWVKAVKKWLTKNTKYVFAVCKNDTGKRHLHASFFLSDPKDKKKMRENLWDRQVKPYHPTSIWWYAVHIQACPGPKWISEYLLKDATVELVIKDLPEDLSELDEYYPTKDVQDRLEAAKDKVVDVFYSTHEEKYKDWLRERKYDSSTMTAHEYFYYRMFVAKDVCVIADSRQVHQMSLALHRYATGSSKLTHLEEQTHAKEHSDFDYTRG